MPIPFLINNKGFKQNNVTIQKGTANSLILNNKQIGESLLCKNDGSALISFTKEVYTLETCLDKLNEGVYI